MIEGQRNGESTQDDGRPAETAPPGWRRRILLAGLACAALPAAAQSSRPAQCRRTPDDAVGPFYRPNQPAQTDLCIRPVPGQRLEVSGRVLSFPDCRVVPGAVIEVWHADGRGDYSRVSSAREDDLACLLRGTLRSGEDGAYRFRTLDPGAYTGRPRHLHLRVSAAGYRTLVTQMYFEAGRGIDARQVASVTPSAGADAPVLARFDLVIAPV